MCGCAFVLVTHIYLLKCCNFITTVYPQCYPPTSKISSLTPHSPKFGPTFSNVFNAACQVQGDCNCWSAFTAWRSDSKKWMPRMGHTFHRCRGSGCFKWNGTMKLSCQRYCECGRERKNCNDIHQRASLLRFFNTLFGGNKPQIWDLVCWISETNPASSWKGLTV